LFFILISSYDLPSKKSKELFGRYGTTLEAGVGSQEGWLKWDIACGEVLPDGWEGGKNPVKKAFLTGQDSKTLEVPERHGPTL
jgi:hypothetical protein